MGLRTQLARKIVSVVFKRPKTRRAVMERLLEERVMLFRELDDHSVVFFPNDVVGRSIFETGEFARQSVSDLRAMLEAQGAFKAGMSVLEIGANIGTHTIYFFRDLDCDKVIAIEPDPENLDLLQHNMALNGLSERVTALGVAASDRAGQAQFTRDLFNRGGSRLGADRTSGPSRESFSVDVVKIDDLVQSGDIEGDALGLIWMDVEGHELAALKGMRALIAQYKPPIFLEYTPSGRTNEERELRDLLFGTYQAVYAYSNGFQPISRDAFSQITRQVDLLAL